jgi:hypothetical protein
MTLSTPEVSSLIQAESLSFEEVSQYFIGLRTEQVFFSYYRCQECNLLYCPWYFSEAQLSELYSKMPDNLMGKEQAVAGRTQIAYGLWTMKRSKFATNYLELGPDIGLLASFFSKNGSSVLTLVEPNLEVHPYLNSMSSSDIKINIYSDLKEVPANTRPDLSMAVHVFDHLVSPVDTLKKLHKISPSSGSLSIVVHNESSLLRRLLGRKWPPFCLQHPQLYNPASVQEVLSRAGWSLESQKRTVNYYDLLSLALNVEEVTGMKLKLPKFLQKLTLGIPVGNMMYFAKKN